MAPHVTVFGGQSGHIPDDPDLNAKFFGELWGAYDNMPSWEVNHGLTAGALAWLGVMMGLGVFYWLGWAAVVGLLVYEHSLVRPGDLSKLDMAFFNVNGYIAVIVLVAVVTGLWR